MLYQYSTCTPVKKENDRTFDFIKVKVMTIKQLLQSVQDDARPVKGIQFHLAQLSLRGRDIAGTCSAIFVIVILVVYILCDLISIYLQNIYFVSRRFLTYFFPENIGSSPVDVLCGVKSSML